MNQDEKYMKAAIRAGKKSICIGGGADRLCDRAE